MKPVIGTRIQHGSEEVGTVLRVEGELCWVRWDVDGATGPILWRTTLVYGWPGQYAPEKPVKNEVEP